MARKGIMVDWVIGFAIFIIFVAVALGYSQYFLRPKTGRMEELKITSLSIADDFEKELSQNFLKVPIKTKKLSNYPIELNYTLEESFKTSSFIEDLSSKLLGNESIWTSTGKGTYNIWYSQSNLSKNIETNLTSSGSTITNKKLTVSFDGECGIQNLTTEYYQQENMEVGKSSCQFENKKIFLTASLDNKAFWRFYSNSSMFRFFGDSVSWTAEEPSWESTNSSGEIDYTDDKLLWDNRTDFFDLYGSGKGLAVLGNSSVRLYNNGTINVQNLEQGLLFYPHQGDYDTAWNYRDFVEGTGYPVEESLIIYDKIEQMKQENYLEIKRRVGWGLNFKLRVEIENSTVLEKGSLPLDKNVIVSRRDSSIYKDGDLKQGEFYVAVWD